ncbi:hypothetical protein EJ06DRAFT_213501 [Trichodelitschia bisporula]|uniref:Uncharacterized protein n=1 Tax=Trichodelitschia bisporula TaxID=703511 RepID=A0A6G1I8M3_9PEZI|nr:hypothetical protein EJ06DRAFT_213501 [Trichodelitschia bisporula]
MPESSPKSSPKPSLTTPPKTPPNPPFKFSPEAPCFVPRSQALNMAENPGATTDIPQNDIPPLPAWAAPTEASNFNMPFHQQLPHYAASHAYVPEVNPPAGNNFCPTMQEAVEHTYANPESTWQKAVEHTYANPESTWQKALEHAYANPESTWQKAGEYEFLNHNPNTFQQVLEHARLNPNASIYHQPLYQPGSQPDSFNGKKKKHRNGKSGPTLNEYLVHGDVARDLTKTVTSMRSLRYPLRVGDQLKVWEHQVRLRLRAIDLDKYVFGDMSANTEDIALLALDRALTAWLQENLERTILEKLFEKGLMNATAPQTLQSIRKLAREMKDE